MEKNVINFSDNGSEFNFVFAGGGESTSYNSKIAGFEALDDLFKKGKITEDDVKEMRNIILYSPKLPWTNPSKQIIVVVGGNMIDLFKALNRFKNSISTPDEPVEVATFKKCVCGGNHGRIYCKDGHTVVTASKNESLSELDVLRKENHVNDEEFEKVKAEIEKELL